jgi:hypothetical protein
MADARETITIRLTHDARAGWERVTLAHGVTLAGLLEAFGLEFQAHAGDVRAEVIEHARRIDFERRSRH